MDDLSRPSPGRRRFARRTAAPPRSADGVPLALRAAAFAALVCAALMLIAALARSAEPAPFPARSGLELAGAAAKAWAPDAYLTYVENDEDLDAAGAAARWGYLFHSPSLDRSRAYSIREGKILVAENLAMKLEAPALAPEWIDSGRALEAADRGAGLAYCQKHQGRLTTMLLMRGAFQDGDPDETTWTLVYTSPSAPALFVVVDASGARVRRTWRG